MAIYLDTNIILKWRGFAALDRLALSIVADQLQLPIVVPWLVGEEARAAHERDLQLIIDRFEEHSAQVEGVFALEYVLTEPTLSTDPLMLEWSRGLEQLGETLTLAPSDAVEGLRREIRGAPPAAPRVLRKPGVGGRDAAIWLSVCRDHAARDEPGHYLTADVSNLLDGRTLKPSLQADLPERSQQLSVWRSVAELLGDLRFTERSTKVAPAALSRDALPAIQNGLRDSMVVPWAVFPNTGPDERFQTRIVRGDAERIISARRYVADGEEIDLVNAYWRLVGQCGVTESETDGFRVVDDIPLEGSIQAYLRQARNGSTLAEFVSAQLTSSRTAYLREDGGLMTIMG